MFASSKHYLELAGFLFERSGAKKITKHLVRRVGRHLCPMFFGSPRDVVLLLLFDERERLLLCNLVLLQLVEPSMREKERNNLFDSRSARDDESPNTRHVPLRLRFDFGFEVGDLPHHNSNVRGGIRKVAKWSSNAARRTSFLFSSMTSL